MSGYLAGLLARAMPPDAADPAPAGEVHPPAGESARADSDPFETTIIDPPQWPPSPQTIVGPASSRAVEAPAPDDRPAPQRVAANAVQITAFEPPVAPARAPARRVTPSAPVEAVEDTSIAQTLRPASSAERPLIEPPSLAAPPTPEPRTADDRLAIADRFMSTVLPGALLPPEVRIEKTREVVRETTEVRTLQPTSDAQRIEPSAPPHAPAPDAPAASGLVIGSLRVTVVPPAVTPAAGPASSAAAAARVVVVRNSSAAPGVPSFSRIG